MREMLKFYIDGEWVDPITPNPVDVINPATEEPCGRRRACRGRGKKGRTRLRGDDP
jgi:acyl-CoA reductase-like NAD-dependent aldehyde dehydrogenase